MPGSKHWCFTLNNYTDEELNRFRDIGAALDRIEYFVFGQEVGESGTPHLQCFISWNSRRSLAYCRRELSSRAHYESAKGSPHQAATYCKKDGKFEEYGNCPRGRGQRNDLAACAAAIRNGKRRKELFEEFITVCARYPKFVNECRMLYSGSRDWKTFVTVYWGETGTGKTRKAFEATTEPYVHSGGQWFDGYDGEEEVIFDDFGGSEFKLTYLLKLLDRYPMRVQVKGGFVNWIPKKIYITSNYSPKEWYSNAKDEHVKALYRRLDRVVRFRRMASCYGPGDDSFEEELCVE